MRPDQQDVNPVMHEGSAQTRPFTRVGGHAFSISQAPRSNGQAREGIGENQEMEREKGIGKKN